MNDSQWQEWLRKSAPSERCILIELNHSEGTEYLSSRAYVSQPDDPMSNQPFRDCLTEAFEMDDSDDLTLGDIEFSWPGRISELRRYYWRGYPFTVWMGAQSWPMSDFKVIASGYNESVQRTRRDRLKVWMAGHEFALYQPLSSSLSGSVSQTVEAIASQCGLPSPVFEFFDDSQLNTTVFVEKRENPQKCVEALSVVADTVGAIVNTDKDGVIHFVFIDYQREADFVIYDDDLVEGSLREGAEQRALSQLVVKYFSGDSTADLLATNDAPPYPGDWVESKNFSTVFNSQAGAQSRLERLKSWHFLRRIPYSAEVFMRGVEFQRGHRIRLISDSWGEDFTGTVLDVVRRPDTNRFKLELIA